ncbi:MAG: hypothetical protein SOH81_05940 [Acetobacter sp.]|jgi:hypothetical protein
MKYFYLFLTALLSLTSCGLSKEQQEALNSANIEKEKCKAQFPDKIGNMSRQAECLSNVFTQYGPKYAGQYYGTLDRLDTYRLKLWKESDNGIISIQTAHLYYNKAKQSAIANDEAQAQARWANAMQQISRSNIELQQNSMPQSPQSTSNLPVSYQINHFNSQETITGSDGSYITCNRFTSTTTCNKIR